MHEPDCLDAYMQPFLLELQAIGPKVPSGDILADLGIPKPCMGLPESQIGESTQSPCLPSNMHCIP